MNGLGRATSPGSAIAPPPTTEPSPPGQYCGRTGSPLKPTPSPLLGGSSATEPSPTPPPNGPPGPATPPTAARRVYNAAFEKPFTQSPLDWRIAPHPKVKAAVEDGALAVAFGGTENIAWSHVAQLVSLPAGRYALSARVRAEDITTDQGVYIEVCDTRTAPVRGSTGGWTTVTADLNVPRAASCELRLRRDPSRKIESKIAGRLWVDYIDVSPR
jgi:hypothetical protein